MSKTFGLALGAGGARGVAHIGFLLALEEAGIKPNYIAGCSMGALVGGCYAAGLSVDEMRDAALDLKMRDVLDLSPAFVSRMSVLRTKKVQELMLGLIGNINIEDMKIPFKCVATDLYSGKLHTFESGNAEIAIQSSCTIPGIFRPVEHEGMLLVDGGCLCRLPVKIVKDMGADVVVAVDALANTSQPVEKLNNIIELLLRVFDVMDANQTAQRTELEGEIADLVLSPEIEGMSQYLVKDLDRAFEEGYKLGQTNVDKIKELLK